MSNFIRISFICEKAGTSILGNLGRREIKFVKQRSMHTNMLTFIGHLIHSSELAFVVVNNINSSTTGEILKHICK